MTLVLPRPAERYDPANETQMRRVLSLEIEAMRAAQPLSVIQASKVWNPPSVANGAVTSVLMDCLGALVGDPVSVGFSSNAAGTDVIWSAHVQAPNVVRVVMLNMTGGALDLSSGTVAVLVWKLR